MSYETKTKEPRVLKCPFCDRGDIEAVYQPSRVEKRMSRGSGFNGMTPIHIDERYTISMDCPKCGKKGSEIERALNRGEGKRKAPSNEEILKRLKEAGLPTKVGGKRGGTKGK